MEEPKNSEAQTPETLQNELSNTIAYTKNMLTIYDCNYGLETF